MKYLFLCISIAIGVSCNRPLKYEHQIEHRFEEWKKLIKQTQKTNNRKWNSAIYPFQNVSLDWRSRVNDLVSRLNLSEVIDQLSYGGAGSSGPAPAIPRLGIGPFQWNSECLRGYVEAGPATSFPQAINLAATFDKSIVFGVAEAGASEARAKHADFVKQGYYADHTGLNCFSPVINMMVHPLWGRSQETYGEDPSLTAQLSEAFVHGLMGNDSRYIRANANCKHFAAHNGPENIPVSRASFNAVVQEVDMRMTFLPQFEACVKAGALGVMCSYNSLNGIPACANEWLLTEVLRKDWNFTGFVVSDENAVINTLIEFHYFESKTVAAATLLKNGLNLELSWPGTAPPVLLNLPDAIHGGLIDKALLYERVWPLFYTRMRLGEFDPAEMNPYTKYNLSIIQSAPQKNLSLLAAKKSLVLLKHTRNVLPIKANSLATLTLIGPFSGATDQIFGDYSPTPDMLNTVTVEQGLKSLVQDASTLKVLSGCNNTACKDYDSQRTAVVNAAKNERNLIVLTLGTGQLNEAEGNDRQSFELPGEQPTMLDDVVSAAEANGVNVVVLIFSATSANISRAVRSEAVVGLLQCGFPGQETGRALAHVLTLADDDSNPSGRLPYTWYEEASQLPSMTDYDMRNKTYRFMSSEIKPLFGFGFGLSYSEFEYGFVNVPSRVKLSASVASSTGDGGSNGSNKGNNGEERGRRVKKGDVYDVVSLNVSVRNQGPYNGEAVVEIYIKWPAEVYRDKQYERVPNLQLVAFERVGTKAGETRTALVDVDTKWLRLWCNGQYVTPSGSYEVYVGGGQASDSGKSNWKGSVKTLIFEAEEEYYVDEY